MVNFDNYTNENITEHNPKWSYIPDHSYRILTIGGTGSWKTSELFSFIDNEPDIDKIYLHAKDSYKAKYQYLIKNREGIEIKHLNYPKAFIEYLNEMEDVYKNIEEYNSGKKRKVLIVFDDMTADMIKNKKLNSVLTELFIECRKVNISVVFIMRSYFKYQKKLH